MLNYEIFCNVLKTAVAMFYLYFVINYDIIPHFKCSVPTLYD